MRLMLRNITLIFLGIFISNVVRGDVVYDKVIRNFSFIIEASEIYEYQNQFGIISSNLDSTTFEVSDLMFKAKLCGGCLCLGIPYPEERDPVKRKSELRGSIGDSEKYFFMNVILALDYEGNPYFGYDFIEKADLTEKQMLEKWFLTSSIDSVFKLSKVTINNLTNKVFIDGLLEENKKPIKSRSPLLFSIEVPVYNHFYLGIETEINIALPNIPVEEVFVSSEDVQIEGGSGRYKIFAEKTGKCNIKVYHVVGSDTNLVGTSEYRVKKTPLPKAYFMGRTDLVSVSKTSLLQTFGRLTVKIPGFPINVKLRVVRFNCKVLLGGKIHDMKTEGSRFSSEMIEVFKRLSSGDSVEFYDIVSSLPSGFERNLEVLQMNIK